MKNLYLIPLILLTACDLAPDTVVPKARVPDTWNQAVPVEPTTPSAKWSDFGSPELDTLLTQALANNTDIAAALARVEEARAQTSISGSGLYPQVDASGSAGTSHNTGSGAVRNDTREQAGIDISYELDLWRKNSNLRDEAEWELQATQQDRDATRLLVSSEVARIYTGLLAFDGRLTVAANNLKNAQEVLRITELRHKLGSISGLEEAQQRTSVNNTEASIAALKNQRDLFFDQLALLEGVAPASLKTTNTPPIEQLTLPAVDVLHPWQLLERRPDIAAAEARLRAANIDIGVARADALPSLSVGLNAAINGSPFGTATGLVASFFAPIFHGGALQGAIERSEAARDEQTAAYEGVLLTAFREVEDALSTYDAANKRVDSLTRAAEEARRAYNISRAQFQAGSIDFTTLLNTQDALLQAEDSRYGALQARLAASIDLMRALGGPTDQAQATTPAPSDGQTAAPAHVPPPA